MLRAAVVVCLFCAGLAPVLAKNLSLLDDPSLGKDRYGRCIELGKRSPGTAVDQANGWYADGGGAAALHCEALALVDLQRYAEAAEKLTLAAGEGTLGAAPARVDLLDQAGNAWLLAGQAEKADASFSAALAVAPKNSDVLTDRARARGMRKDWSGAVSDLTTVLALDPDRADVLVLRASALHAEGKTQDAKADIDHALRIYPDYPEALIERGNMKFESGDQAGARADWQAVIAAAPGTDAAASAEQRLKSVAEKPAKSAEQRPKSVPEKPAKHCVGISVSGETTEGC